jgi:hypothetical protein
MENILIESQITNGGRATIGSPDPCGVSARMTKPFILPDIH